MGENSAIEWTEHTFNPWSGCTKVSDGCKNCYAEKLANRFETMGEWGPGAERKRTSDGNWRKPLRWDRASATARRNWRRAVDAAEELGESRGPLFPPCPPRPRVFCASLADWLDPEVQAEWLADLLALIAATPHLDWLLLTKRPELWRARLEAAVEACGYADGVEHPGGQLAYDWLCSHGVPPNVWVGTSVEDQDTADSRVPALHLIPARIRFLSCEPLLGSVALPRKVHLTRSVGPDLPFLCKDPDPLGAGTYVALSNPHGALSIPRPEGSSLGIKPAEFKDLGVAADWVIVGGESGPGARPMHPDWARSIRDQCVASGHFGPVLATPFLFKQWGAWETDAFDRERDDPDWGSLPVAKADGRRWLNLAGGHGFHGRRVVLAERKGKKNTGRLLDGRTWDGFPSSALS